MDSWNSLTQKKNSYLILFDFSRVCKERHVKKKYMIFENQ